MPPCTWHTVLTRAALRLYTVRFCLCIAALLYAFPALPSLKPQTLLLPTKPRVDSRCLQLNRRRFVILVLAAATMT